MSRTLQVWGDKDFVIEIPDDAKVTYGPFSPPSTTGGWKGASGASRGTLRIYKGTKTTENVIAVFSGVEGFRDTSLDYTELAPPPKPGAVVLSWTDMSKVEREEFTELVAQSVRRQAIDEVIDEDEEKSPF